MNPSYFRIKLPLARAQRRLALWLRVPDLEGLVATDSAKAVALATTTAGAWRGSALFMYENQGWSVFEDLRGDFGATPADSWLDFATTDSFVFAGYNDAIGYGELVVISEGVVRREFLQDDNDPASAVDRGRLPSESSRQMASWIDAASFVDADRLLSSESGWLWVRESK